MMVMIIKTGWGGVFLHYTPVWVFFVSSSQHNSWRAKKQAPVDTHPFRGRVMGPKSKTTAHWADAQSAAISNWVTNAAKCEVSKDYIVEGIEQLWI